MQKNALTEADALKKLAAQPDMNPKERRALIEHLRQESRYAYLAKRELDKLAELEGDIADEERFFAGEKCVCYAS